MLTGGTPILAAPPAGGPPPSQDQTITLADAARFLEQATFGPTAGDIAHLQDPAVGFDGWLLEQFGMPSPADYIPMENCPTGTGRCPEPTTPCTTFSSAFSTER
jgi:hypothetical protein